MKHEDLLELTSNKTFELAKEYIIQGLSVRLNPYENGIKDTIQINVEPRANHIAHVLKKDDAKGGQTGGNAAGGHPGGLAGLFGGVKKDQKSLNDSNFDSNGLKKSNFENYYERKLHDER